MIKMPKSNRKSRYGESVRKVMKVGQCLGVTLPKQYWEDHDLKVGDYVAVVFNDVLKLKPLYYRSIMRELEAEEELEGENEDERR